MPHSNCDALNGLLKHVSRSFYLTLRILPSAIRAQISLAYLLARASDTIADTDAWMVSQRLNALRTFRERLLGIRPEALGFRDLAGQQSTPAERTLLECLDEVLGTLDREGPEDQQRIREVLVTIISGQELDLQRFIRADARHIVALRTDEELDDYTYRVAGCVGEFWTRLCRVHLFPKAAVDEALLLSDGIRFGKGLQLINILRDLPADLRLGRCYIPEEKLAQCGLPPADLLDPGVALRFRPLFHSYLDRAEGHLAAGWCYTNRLPYRCVRVRLACAWPILIGAQTISKLRSHNPLLPNQRIKVSRLEVRSIIIRSIALYPLPRVWRRMLEGRKSSSAKPIASACLFE